MNRAMDGANGVDWGHWERLLRMRGVTLDRPRGSAHPHYPEVVYPLDYGFIPGTVGGDGAEVDVFVGSAPTGLRAALLSTDARKGDREIKLLWNMTDAEIESARAFINRGAMRAELVSRLERNSVMVADEVFERLLAAADAPFSGWDFSWVSDTGRMSTAPLPWSYASLLAPYLWRAGAMADLGTGGGEFLSRLSPLPPQTFATEGYAPNLLVARTQLEPLGVQVFPVDESDSLPFAADALDLIINRHESYRPEEVARALRPGGHFITQQVDGPSQREVSDWLGVPFDVDWADWNLDGAARGLEAAGFAIVDRREALSPTRFYDIGALAYYLKTIPWQIPDFSVARYHDHLRDLHERIQSDGYLEYPSARFLIIARKPE